MHVSRAKCITYCGCRKISKQYTTAFQSNQSITLNLFLCFIKSKLNVRFHCEINKQWPTVLLKGCTQCDKLSWQVKNCIFPSLQGPIQLAKAGISSIRQLAFLYFYFCWCRRRIFLVVLQLNLNAKKMFGKIH